MDNTIEKSTPKCNSLIQYNVRDLFYFVRKILSDQVIQTWTQNQTLNKDILELNKQSRASNQIFNLKKSNLIKGNSRT